MPYKDKEVKKAKHKAYSAKHYANNQEKIKQQTKDSKALQRVKWYLFKATLKCAHCGGENQIVQVAGNSTLTKPGK